MKIRDYMKKKENIDMKDLLSDVSLAIKGYFEYNRRAVACVISIMLLLPIISIFAISKNVKESEIDSIEMVTMADVPIAASSSKKGVITIPNGIVKANPFVPYRDISNSNVVTDVPVYNLVEPPEVVNENSDAARVMDTIVSGILYDKYSPSAILNIEGNDYLVKKGDVVNNYKVLNITQDSVTVKLGSNTYKAGIGEILTEGTLNHNDISNLNNKFGGVR